MNKKNKVGYFIGILGIVVLVIGLAITILSPNDNPSNNDSNQQENEEDIKDFDINKNVSDETQKAINIFLSHMIGSKKNGYDVFDEVAHNDLTDEDIIIAALRILYSMKEYTKDNGVYYYSLDNVQKIVKKYLTNNEVNYDIDSNSKIKFNSINNRYELSSQKILFTNEGTIIDFKISEYKKTDQNYEVICTVIKEYNLSGDSNNKREETRKYILNLIQDDDSFVITNLEEYLV